MDNSIETFTPEEAASLKVDLDALMFSYAEDGLIENDELDRAFASKKRTRSDSEDESDDERPVKKRVTFALEALLFGPHRLLPQQRGVWNKRQKIPGVASGPPPTPGTELFSDSWGL